MNSKIRNILIIALVLLFIGYGAYEANRFLYGLSAEIFYPSDGEFLENTHITLRGRATEASFIELNGRMILTDEEGFFEEDLVLASGLNVLELSAKDRFGRKVVDKREVVVE